MRRRRLLLVLLAAAPIAARAQAPHGPWDASIDAPASREMAPRAVHVLSGGAEAEAPDTLFLPPGSSASLDFGGETGGPVSFDVVPSRNGATDLALSFSESRLFAGAESDSSAGGIGNRDGASAATVRPGTHFAMPDAFLRGGFRFLTLRATGGAPVRLRHIRVAVSFAPGTELRRYGGFFRSSDPLLDRIWYAGAYTLQTNIVATNSGRAFPFIHRGWNNAASLGVGDSVLVDGAKRDRAVWPGDMGIAVPALFASVGTPDPVRNALQTLIDNQEPDGALPECGPPLLKRGSDTYHLWTLIGIHRYALYSGDTGWLRRNWSAFKRALSYSLLLRAPDGLMRVAGARDWGRLGQGGENLAANVLLHEALRSGAELASLLGDADGACWSQEAAALRTAIDRRLWDEKRGAYRDNPDSMLLPQDGNSLAVWYGIAVDRSRQDRILSLLRGRWNRFGAVSAELPGTIAPFAGSMEVMARFRASDDAGALALIRRQWGFMLDDPDSTGNTLLEGFLADGSLGYRGDQGYQHDPSYVSHAHGWSAGPTAALSFFVLGLQPTALAGRRWSLLPHPGDLTSVEGGFSTALGLFRAAWHADGHGHLSALEIHTPRGTDGQLPLAPGTRAMLDGHSVAIGPDGVLILSGGAHRVALSP